MGIWTEKINDCAKNRFGFSSLLPVQQLVVHNILEAISPSSIVSANNEIEHRDTYQNQLVILPTGTGKSACFQIPATLIDGLTVIIYPLLSLISDQLRRFNEIGLTSYKLVGGMSQEEINELTESLQNNTCKCILTNPETLGNTQYSKLLASYKPQLIVIDEAHCISKWGNTFRKSYLNIGAQVQQLQAKVVVAFTATASKQVIDDINKILFLSENMYLLHGDSNRENITYSVIRCFNKNQTLASLFSKTPQAPCLDSDSISCIPEAPKIGMYPVHTTYSAVEKPAIVFCSSRLDCESLALMLRDSLNSKEIYYYHAGLTKPEKQNIEEWFLHSTDGILIATCAYGMGVDKSNIRTVIHYEPYTDIENFLQETGRAGRDKQASISIMLEEFNTEKLQQEKTILCRREFFMSALHLSCEGCTGCDICIGAAPILPWEFLSIIQITKRVSRYFDSKELSNYIVTKLLQSHEKIEMTYLELQLRISHAVSILLSQGILVKGKYLWKNKISVCDALANQIISKEKL